MKFPLYMAQRYLVSKTSNNAINLITLISAISIVVGAAALFVVLSGFSGLREFSLSFSSIFDPDLKVLPAQGKYLENAFAKAKQIEQHPEVVAFSEVVEERAFLEFRGKNHIAYIKGVDQRYTDVNPIDSTIFYGTYLRPDSPTVVIGSEISRLLTLSPNVYTNLLQIMVPKPGTGQITDPSQAFSSSGAVVSGIYQVNEELDGKYVVSSLEFAQELLSLERGQISAIEIKLRPETEAETVQEELAALLGPEVNIKSRVQLNDALYKMLNAENLAVYFIFTLVLIIALFNLVGSVIMIILDKQKNIKTLYSLGATLKDIRRIFFIQGSLMTIIGGFVGLFIGFLIVLAQRQLGLVMITSTLPYPVRLEAINFITVFITISLLGLLAARLASTRVTKSMIA
ncbi:ABC transporter permease [Croceiramulus getboli]|nr:ABC transporter permease [Flavobacteriaceae bacterium YJPT1-3]